MKELRGKYVFLESGSGDEYSCMKGGVELFRLLRLDGLWCLCPVLLNDVFDPVERHQYRNDLFERLDGGGYLAAWLKVVSEVISSSATIDLSLTEKQLQRLVKELARYELDLVISCESLLPGKRVRVTGGDSYLLPEGVFFCWDAFFLREPSVEPGSTIPPVWLINLAS